METNVNKLIPPSLSLISFQDLVSTWLTSDLIKSLKPLLATDPVGLKECC